MNHRTIIFMFILSMAAIVHSNPVFKTLQSRLATRMLRYSKLMIEKERLVEKFNYLAQELKANTHLLGNQHLDQARPIFKEIKNLQNQPPTKNNETKMTNLMIQLHIMARDFCEQEQRMNSDNVQELKKALQEYESIDFEVAKLEKELEDEPILLPPSSEHKK